MNLIYPHRCPICHKILKNQRAFVCQKCFLTLSPIAEPRCKKCGRPVNEEQEFCLDCSREKRSFREGRGIFLYTESMQKTILLYKYGGRREYARFLGEAMISYGRAEMKRWKIDLIVPIPLHKKKLRQRGFNQTELLANLMSERLGVDTDREILIKVIPTRSQKKLDEKERRRNLKEAFEVRKNVRNLRILLIDDVYTTGSTIDAAASCLVQAGASEVFFLTLCIAGFS